MSLIKGRVCLIYDILYIRTSGLEIPIKSLLFTSRHPVLFYYLKQVEFEHECIDLYR